MIAALFVLGPLVVVPLLLRVVPSLGSATADRAIATARRVALPAGILLAVAFALPAGFFTAALALPWLGLGALTMIAAASAALAAVRAGRLTQPTPDHALWAALAFLPVAGVNAVADRFGFPLLGFAPTVVLLTAVHFTFAGFGLVVVGALVAARRPSRLAEGSLGSVIVGIPLTAIGFLGVPVAAVLGAVAVACGGIGIGVGLLRVAAGLETTSARGLTRLAGASLLLSMPLAIAYAVGLAIGAVALDVPRMAAIHGTLNVLGFAIPASIAWWLETRGSNRPTPPVAASPPVRPSRRWAIGLVTGLATGVGALVAGPAAGIVAVVAVAALAARPPRLAPVAGLWLGFGAAWLVLFGTAQARCGPDCVFPDPSPWIATGLVGLALGGVLTAVAWRAAR